MDSEGKAIATVFALIIVGLVVVVMTLCNHKAKTYEMFSENGYEQVMVIGHDSPIWQKVEVDTNVVE